MTSSARQIAQELFYNRTGMDAVRIANLVTDTLARLEDGELYLEHTLFEAFGFNDGRLQSTTFNTRQGFGLRGVRGETTGFAHATEVSEAAIRRAGETLATIGTGGTVRRAKAPAQTNRTRYASETPLDAVSFAAKIQRLAEMDAYVRARDPRVAQVAAALSGSWSVIEILRPNGGRAWDVRPLVRLHLQVLAQAGNRRGVGTAGLGGRYDYGRLLAPASWQAVADEALRQALVNLEAAPAPAGERVVVLGPGWPGVLLHEAVGHGLEGDFNRKGLSAFSGRLGTRVAAPGITVVDDGSVGSLSGSLAIDDEGTPCARTVLIEDGILKGYLQDRLNARLMGAKPTGNGRRESFAHAPLPRMTNTFMLAGDRDPAEILGSVKTGLYVKAIGGGEVDITSGKFVFTCTESYAIENGTLGRPLQGATLIGNGPDVLIRVTAIGNDLALDPGIGVCSKDGQSVPAGVGQPTLRIDGLTVGGTG